MASVTKTNSGHRVRRAAAATRIVEATERLLNAGERYTEIPVERLLAEADVSRSTFYVHFADKGELLIAVAEKVLEQVASTAETWWRTDHSEGPAGAAATVAKMIKVYRRHIAVLRTLAEVGAYDDSVRDLHRNRLEAYAQVDVVRLAAEQSAGLIDADVDLLRTVRAVLQLVDSGIIDHVVHGSPRDDKLVAAVIGRIGWLAHYGHAPAS